MSIEAKNQKDLERLSKTFKFFFYGTPVITLLLFVAQLFFTSGIYSFDPSKLANWQNFSSTFALPLGGAAALLATTSLIGMYHRSLQLTVQLEKVQEQIALSNKQFQRSEEQFALSQSQFKLAQEQLDLNFRKENFALYKAHKDHIKDVIETVLEGKKAGPFSNLFETRVTHDVLYELLFPENSVQEMRNLGEGSHAEEYYIRLKKLDDLLQSPVFDKLTPSEQVQVVFNCISEFGIAIKPKDMERFPEISNLDWAGCLAVFEELFFMAVCFVKVSTDKELARHIKGKCLEIKFNIRAKLEERENKSLQETSAGKDHEVD